MKKLFLLCAAVTLGALTLAPIPTRSQKIDRGGLRQPAGKFIARGADAIPGQYIVVFHDWATGEKGETSVAAALAGALTDIYGGRVERAFRHAVNGFAARMSKEQALALSNDPRVAFVEEDAVVHAIATQAGATWGLDRVDQRNLPLSTTYTYNNTGAGVNAYVIDTGIRTTHADFGGRASAAFDAFGGNGQDCNGHGTHVAGTVGGAAYGVAKGVTLRGVRVLDCNGSGATSGVIAGVDWVTANHVKPAVANMSLGGGASTALDTAVRNSIIAGVTYSLAAGNGNFLGIAQDACRTSPARVAEAITVSATDKTDKKASFANYGTCLDIFAPGVGITSAWSTSDTATNTISGTSMAAPHVAGVAALYLQTNAAAAPQQVRDALVNNATLNKVTSPGSNSPNRLLFTNY